MMRRLGGQLMFNKLKSRLVVPFVSFSVSFTCVNPLLATEFKEPYVVMAP